MLRNRNMLVLRFRNSLFLYVPDDLQEWDFHYDSLYQVRIGEYQKIEKNVPKTELRALMG